MKKTIIIGALIISAVLLINLISAGSYLNLCLKQGEKVRFSKCNSGAPDYTCPKDQCSICVYKLSDTVYCSGGLSCGVLGNGDCSSLNNTEIDSSPPNITINTPYNNEIFNTKSILLDIQLDEIGEIYYKDNTGKNTWIKLCSQCDIYNQKKNFKEGLNNITFKAVDYTSHSSYITRIFSIDSQLPKIDKTEPRSGYADGKFEVQYSEENLKKIILYYGNTETGFRNKILTSCISGEKQLCSFVVDLKDYNNEKIQYYFEVEDIVGNIKKSQIKQNLNVDTIFPVLNNPSLFWNYVSGSRYVYFKFNVTEKNLDKITYSYLDSKNKTKEFVICSKLDKNNLCEAKKSFTKGSYVLDIQITDKAGNAIGKSISFNVNY
jgi:hypothetical protein